MTASNPHRKFQDPAYMHTDARNTANMQRQKHPKVEEELAYQVHLPEYSDSKCCDASAIHPKHSNAARAILEYSPPTREPP